MDHPHMLEAGCGPGRESRLLMDRGHERGLQIQVTAVDISKGLLAIAKERNPDVTYEEADFRSLPFEPATFDGLLSHASMVHLETEEDVRKTLSEFFRVLKPGAVAFIKVKMKTDEATTEVVSDSFVKHDRFMRYYTVEELQTFLTEAGFEVVSHYTKDDSRGRDEVKWIHMYGRKPQTT
jgi:ubiquinone/menaquinone biosynthesis C-methylase UbiE